MAFQLSPGVQVTEKDLTNVVPAVGSSIGGTVMQAGWGPANEIVLVSTENEMVSMFGKPQSTNNKKWFAAASFLAYTNTLKVVRAIDTDEALNATSTVSGVAAAGVLVENGTKWENGNYSNSGNAVFIAKYAGEIGNSLKVEMADQSNGRGAITLTGDWTSTTSSTAFTATGGAATTELKVGDVVSNSSGTIIGTIATITDDDNIVLSGNAAVAITAAKATNTRWSYADDFDYVPGTTKWATDLGGSQDEMHIIVVDADGSFTGTAGTVLEKFSGVSKASGSKDSLGQSNYWKDVLNNRSAYVWADDSPAGHTNWGNPANTTFTLIDDLTDPTDVRSNLANGLDDAQVTTAAVSDAELMKGYDLFANDELVDVNLIFVGDASATVGDYVIDNVAEVRRDCVVIVSPSSASVIGRVDGAEASNAVAELAGYTRSSYAVIDSGWKYMYNRYADSYTYIPCNGDVAGLCAKTDDVADPWFSPAGYNRGAIKNAVRLAWSPNKAERDTLYKNGINPIVGFPGSGIVLFGDKTMLEKPSAFDRINVRRLFITLEKAIATAAKFQLFEFNDAFTRAQFKSLVDPFLRDVQGRRGIYAFKVVCDESNNTGQVIDSNSFVADIYIQPARSINFIQLNFIATRTGVAFEEVGA